MNPTPPGQPPPFQPPPPDLQFPPPGLPKKGRGALTWILLGVGFLLLCMVAIVSIGGYILHRKSLAVVDDNQPAEVRIAGDGQAGGIEINGPDGNVRFGSSAGTGLPAWMPAYPGATIRGNMVGQRGKEAQDNSTFKTKDSPVQVISFYENHFKGAGFEILSVAKTDVNGSLSGLSADRKRTVAIVAGTSDEGTEVGVSVIETK